MTRSIYDLGSWIILRMASGDTLRVAKSLKDAGLEVWTPVERRIGRTGSSRVRAEKERALMPSYAFGRVEHIAELLRLSVFQSSEHPRFRVHHERGGVPLIADDELGALRDEETRITRLFDKWKRRGMKGPVLSAGTEINMPDGPFAGLSGIVEGATGEFTLVSFEGFHRPIKIASCLLLENVAQDGLPLEARAARAA